MQLVYRIRNKETGDTFATEQGSKKGVYVSKGAAQSKVDRYNRWNREANRPEIYEVVTYELHEVTEESK